jgi:hypothetical protein
MLAYFAEGCTMKTLIVALVVTFVAMPLLGVQAQGTDGLSDDELALLDRLDAVAGTPQTYTRFSSVADDALSFDATFDVGEPIETGWIVRRVMEIDIIRDGAQTNVAGMADVAVTWLPDHAGSYEIEADIVFVDRTLYVDAAYAEADGEVSEIESGWQRFRSSWEIPAALEELELHELFTGDDENNIFDRPDIIERAVTGVRLETDEMDDGRPVDVIILDFEGQGAIQAFLLMGADDQGLFSVMFNPESDGMITVSVMVDDHENLVGWTVDWTSHVEDLDLTPFNIQDIPDGSTLTATMSRSYVETLSNIDGEIDPIVTPVD